MGALLACTNTNDRPLHCVQQLHITALRRRERSVGVTNPNVAAAPQPLQEIMHRRPGESLQQRGAQDRPPMVALVAMYDLSHGACNYEASKHVCTVNLKRSIMALAYTVSHGAATRLFLREFWLIC